MKLEYKWLPKATRHLFRGKEGQNYLKMPVKWKVLVHTTEGSSVSGAEAAFARYPPHFIYDRRDSELKQYVPLDKAAYALRSTTSERSHVIQIELVGFAKDSQDWTNDELAEFVHLVLFPIWQVCPFDLQHPGFQGSEGYGIRAKTRFRRARWSLYSGFVGHCHSPQDRHWDPGEWRADKMMQILRKVIESDQATEQATLEVTAGKIGFDVTDLEGLTVAETSRAIDLLEEIALTMRYSVDTDKLMDRIYRLELGRKRSRKERYWIELLDQGESLAAVIAKLRTTDEAANFRAKVAAKLVAAKK